jgi:glycosyltransferase involved in cell wall biosynthesis
VENLEDVYMAVLEDEKREASPGYPMCSIIIPVYNKAKYVAEAIESALNQKQAPTYEIIVIDDGSTDDSLEVARQAAKGHPNVTVLMQANQGVAAARNNAIKASRGKYIACLDADDRIEPLFLNRLSAALTSDPGLGLVYSDFMAFGPGRPDTPLICAEYDFDTLKTGNMLPCCNLFRRKAWEASGGYKNINPSWEDYELWLNMGRLGWPGKRVPGTLFWYRKVPQQGRDFESQGQAWKLRAAVNRYHRDLYNPLVSFVIPCYKQAEFLPDSINSALAQTFKDIEVVVVDDGNEPEEAKLIRDIVETYHPEDVKLVVNETNLGLARTRNAGIEASKGTWFVPLDADDKIEPTFLEECMKASALHPKKFAYTDSFLWWPAQDKTDKIEAKDYDFNELLSKISWSCTILCPVDAWRQVGGYKDQMSKAGGWEDWEFAVSLGELGICGERVAKPLFWYRQHSAEQMRYKAEQNKPELRETLRQLHAGTYRGEKGPMCCGNKTYSRSNGNKAAVGQNVPTDQPIPEGEGTLVRYVGNSMGTQQWRGPSGKSYKFGLVEPLQKVRQVDVVFFRDRSEFQVVEA